MINEMYPLKTGTHIQYVSSPERPFYCLLQFPFYSQNVSVGKACVPAFHASLVDDAASAIFIPGQL
jgi:hypothetical protein